MLDPLLAKRPPFFPEIIGGAATTRAARFPPSIFFDLPEKQAVFTARSRITG